MLATITRRDAAEVREIRETGPWYRPVQGATSQGKTPMRGFARRPGNDVRKLAWISCDIRQLDMGTTPHVPLGLTYRTLLLERACCITPEPLQRSAAWGLAASPVV
jgi:hypothetical protein